MKHLVKYLLVVFTLMLSWMAGVHIQHEIFTLLYIVVLACIAISGYSETYYEESVVLSLNIMVYLLAIFTFGQFSWSSWIGG